MDAGAFGPHPLGELGIRYGYNLQQEVLAERVGIFSFPGLVVGKVPLQPGAQAGFVRLGGQFIHYLVVNFPQLFSGAAGVLVVEIMGYFLEERFHYWERRREDDACFRGYGFGQGPLLRQKAAGGGFLVVMDKRQAGVFHGQHSRAYGHLERCVQCLCHGMRQAELGFYVQLAAPGGQLYGLVHGIYLFNAVVARGGFYHADDVLVYLFSPPFGRDGLYHVLAGQYLVEVMLAEQLVPSAGRAAGYAGNRYRVEVETELLGERRLVGRQRGGRGIHGSRAPRRACRFEGPILVVRVEEFPSVLRQLAFPFYGDAKGRHIGQQVVELCDTAAFGVVGGQHGDVRLVLQRGGGESAEHAFGAALYKGAHALGVHALQLFYEFHGAGHLFDQHVVDALRVRREEIRGDIGQDLHVRGLDRDVLQELAVRAHGRGYYFGMEGV